MKPKNLPSLSARNGNSSLFIPYSDDVIVNMDLFSLTAGKYFKQARKAG
jgi:hypothetical protein